MVKSKDFTMSFKIEGIEYIQPDAYALNLGRLVCGKGAHVLQIFFNFLKKTIM